MKHLVILTLLMGANVVAQPALPALFKTAGGAEIKTAKVLALNPDSVKIMHESGIVTLKFSDLPAEVLKVLGVEAPSASSDVPVMPSTLTVKGRLFTNVKLIGVDPDGLRILHNEGGGKIAHEDLPQELSEVYGPFDVTQAQAFREQQKEIQRNLYRASQELIKEQNEKVAKERGENQKGAVEAASEAVKILREDPALVSSPVYVLMSAQSTGGKDRDTPFRTDYGSFINEDISTRTMTCQVKSNAGFPQRVRIQCLMLTRPIAGGNLAADVVGETLVELGAGAARTVTASGAAESSDMNFAALGVRYKSGVKYVGWCWRAIDGLGRVTTVVSSIPHYDRFGWQTPLK